MTLKGEDIRETEGEPPRPEEMEALEGKLEALERQVLRLNENLVWAARVLGPIVAAALFLAFLFVFYPREMLGYVVAYPWPHVNKALVVTAVLRGYSVFETTVIFSLTDLIVALWFVVNFPVLYRIPRLGAKLEAAERRMKREVHARRSLRVSGALLVFLWVFVPFPGTGTITGSILGRFLGLGTWRNYAVVGTSAIVAVYAYAATAGAIVSAFERSAAEGWTALVVVAGLCGIGWIVYRSWWKPRRARRRAAHAQSSRGAAK